jgi:hypothetical protein
MLMMSLANSSKALVGEKEEGERRKRMFKGGFIPVG